MEIGELQASTLNDDEGCNLTVVICRVRYGSSLIKGSRMFPFAVRTPADEVHGNMLARHKRAFGRHTKHGQSMYE
jgi:hypothetical protein